MDNLLDKTGVKRLLSNIKNWVENKFIDVEDKIYYPWEIQYLVNECKLKPGKQYMIYYNYEKNLSYYNNISFADYNFPIIIHLTAINTINFDENAVILFRNYETGIDKVYTCIFNYGRNKYAEPYVGSNIIRIIYNNSTYYLEDINNSNSSYSIIRFSNDSNYIYIRDTNLKSAKSGTTINIFLDEDCTTEAQGIYYYTGLGTITYLKDNKGNEAPFDFINLKINNKAIITGRDNIIKSFFPDSPIFIEGNYNFVDYICREINIIGNNNIVEKECISVNINGSANYIGHNTTYSGISDSHNSRIGYNSHYVYIRDTSRCNVGNYCIGIDTNDLSVGNNCYFIDNLKNHCGDNKCFDELTDSPIRNFVIKKAERLDIDNSIGDASNENIIVERYQDGQGEVILTILLKTGLITKDLSADAFYIEEHSGFNYIDAIFGNEKITGDLIEVSVAKENNELCAKFVFNFEFGNYSLSSEDLDSIWLYIEREDYFYFTICNENYDYPIEIR